MIGSGSPVDLFRTKTDELTVEVQSLTFLAKGLRPLPEKWHGLTDIETRYRQRYVDLIANPECASHFLHANPDNFHDPHSFLTQRDFLEVETPMMQPIPGGCHCPSVYHSS